MTTTRPDLSDTVVLVTGANGFVGARVCQALAAAGADVRAQVRRAGAALTAPGVTEVVADLDADALAAAMGDVTHVVHTAATAGPDLDLVRAVNVDGTRAVVDAADRSGVTRLVHVSTTSVVHDDEAVVSGDARLVDDAASPYAVTKRDAEAVVATAGVDTVVLRPPAVLGWGPTSTWGQKVPAWVAAGELPMEPDPRADLGWVHVDDFADAIALALVRDELVGTTHVVANGTVTWKDYLGTVHGWFPDAPDPFVPADDEPAPRRWDASGIGQAGWVPTRSFDDAMDEIAAHHR